VLVAGHDWQSVTAACKPLNGFVALNSRFAEGMSTSIATGVKAVSETAAGVLLLLADQPLISEEHLAALAEAWNSSRDSVCVTTYAGTEGPPVIFPARLFPELIALRGDRGAKPVLDANRQSIVAVPCEVAAVDIDTPEDLRRIRGQSTFV
jgi:molybdenum cofactor cytidylyltransferase